MMKTIEYGYWWNCASCGEENAYGLTEKEAEEYIISVERYCLMMYQLFLLEQKKTSNNIKRLAA